MDRDYFIFRQHKAGYKNFQVPTVDDYLYYNLLCCLFVFLYLNLDINTVNNKYKTYIYVYLNLKLGMFKIQLVPVRDKRD